MTTPKVLGLACLATFAAAPAFAAEPVLQTSSPELDQVQLRASAELLNKHWSPSASQVLHHDATGHGSFSMRWFDVGVHLDGYMVLDGDSGPRDQVTNDFEITEMTGRLDYLLEVENYIQILPFLEATVYPFQQGTTRFNWLGAELWYLTPIEGIEVGGSAQYNLADNGTGIYENLDDNYWLGRFGVRQFWQDAPIDLAAWQMVGVANRAYHRMMTGTDTQGITTVDLGARLTMPLPWEELWASLKVEGIWYADSDDRRALYEAGEDRAELVFAIGMEWRAE